MTQVRWMLPLLVLLFGVAPVDATPITYTVTGTATGMLGLDAFADALVTVTLVGDTVFVGDDAGSATVSVSGVGTASFTDTMVVTDTSGNPSAQISDLTLNRLTFGTTAQPFATYDLRTPIGPVSGIALINGPLTMFPTTAGNFDIESVSGNTAAFTATTATAVPEPGSIWLLGAGLLAARVRTLAARRR